MSGQTSPYNLHHSETVDFNAVYRAEAEHGHGHMMTVLPILREFVEDWLQNLLDIMLFYQTFNSIASSYDGYPLPKGFPFPATIQPALGVRATLPLNIVLENLPLFSQREERLFWAAKEIRASDCDAVLLQSELFCWIEELDRRDQFYWVFPVFLMMYGYPVLRWTQDTEGRWEPPLVWELRWKTTVLGALELDSTILSAESAFRNLVPLLTAEFVLQSLVLSVQTHTTIVLVRNRSRLGVEFIPGRRL
ncbi:hypothetical protein C8R42DRAFT_441020 [Lentinula raphanica]|nr:hypothetical protein C8R42DRAFT_441020 [Lentinula raphanica]